MSKVDMKYSEQFSLLNLIQAAETKLLFLRPCGLSDPAVCASCRCTNKQDLLHMKQLRRRIHSYKSVLTNGFTSGSQNPE